jgi:hypothetical protein
MQTVEMCMECGAVWRDGITCLDHFHQMLAWEFEDPGGAGTVHHLSVLCYNLQHPSVYSPDALTWAKALLGRYVVEHITPQQVRDEHRESLASRNRPYKIRGTAESHGVYVHPVTWTTTIDGVTKGGLVGYCERVEAWSRSVYEVLVKSGNYSAS